MHHSDVEVKYGFADKASYDMAVEAIVSIYSVVEERPSFQFVFPDTSRSLKVIMIT